MLVTIDYQAVGCLPESSFTFVAGDGDSVSASWAAVDGMHRVIDDAATYLPDNLPAGEWEKWCAVKLRYAELWDTRGGKFFVEDPWNNLYYWSVTVHDPARCSAAEIAAASLRAPEGMLLPGELEGDHTDAQVNALLAAEAQLVALRGEV